MFSGGAGGITQIVQITKLKGNEKIIIQVPKYEVITSHSGRRSLVTYLSNLGLTPKEISLITGHKQLSIVDIYDKSRADLNAVKVFGIVSKK